MSPLSHSLSLLCTACIVYTVSTVAKHRKFSLLFFTARCSRARLCRRKSSLRLVSVALMYPDQICSFEFLKNKYTKIILGSSLPGGKKHRSAPRWSLIMPRFHVKALRSVLVVWTTRAPLVAASDIHRQVPTYVRLRPWLLCTNTNSACHPSRVG